MDFLLTMVRHGESEANVRHMLSGWMDVDLTERGRAELLELRESVEYPVSDAYFSSPLRRCLDTCHILFPSASPALLESCREINFRSLEGWVLSTKEEIDAYFSAWVRDEPYLDEETISDVMGRSRKAVLSTVDECGKKGLSSATIVMHSGIMRSLIIALFGLPKEEFNRMTVPNGLGYVVTFDGLTPLSYRKIERPAASS